jgi:hypothetical protein
MTFMHIAKLPTFFTYRLSCSGESIGLTQCFNPAFEVGGEPPTTNGTRLPECLAAETQAGRARVTVGARLAGRTDGL